jgi:hypothetical protein
MNFLILGFFRTGTTLVSNILNSHNKTHCVVDPFILILKSFRNEISKYKKKHLVDSDLENFTIPQNKDLLKKITISSFNKKISKNECKKIHKNLLNLKSYQHPELRKIEQSTSSKTYKDIFLYYLKEFQKLAKQNKKYLGTKISWGEEYIPVFKRSFPKINIIYLVRNITDCINSALNSLNYSHHTPSAIRPILYYILYWKKSVNFYKKYRGKKIFFLKYEDLVSDLDFNKKRLFHFLKIKDSKIDILKDQYGRVWSDNSSYSRTKRNIWLEGYKPSKKNIELIKNKRNKKFIINDNLINLIHYLCKNEMDFLNYKRNKKIKFKKKEIISALKNHDKKFTFPKQYNKYLDYEEIIDLILKN